MYYYFYILLYYLFIITYTIIIIITLLFIFITVLLCLFTILYYIIFYPDSLARGCSYYKIGDIVYIVFFTI